MAKIENATLLKECTRIALAKKMVQVVKTKDAQGKEHENIALVPGASSTWDAEDSAIACMRVILEEFGCTELLKPEHAESRKEVLAIIKPMFTAPINFERQYLHPSGLAPKREKGVTAATAEYV